MKRDFLALVMIGAGSSYARGPDKDDCVKRCASIAHSDWGSLYDMDGKELTINVFDVTGYDKLWWDSRGVHIADDPKYDATLENEMAKVTLPIKKRRRRA